MAPKHPNKTTRIEHYDKNKFVSLVAFVRYIESVVKKASIFERGMEVRMHAVAAPIENRGWDKLVEHHEPIVISVVREFYANSFEHKNYRHMLGENKFLLIET